LQHGGVAIAGAARGEDHLVPVLRKPAPLAVGQLPRIPPRPSMSGGAEDAGWGDDCPDPAAHFVQGKTIKAIAREFGFARDTVRTVLRSGGTSPTLSERPAAAEAGCVG
jgi:hypothetical protein